MATFAPQDQLQDVPNYLRLAGEPIQQPEADKSKGLALSNIGEGISGTANLAEQTFEDYMKEHIHAGVDALREGTTLAYENVRKAQETGGKVDPAAAAMAGFGGKSTPSLAGDTPSLPPGLESGLDKVSQLGLAKSQGRANDTLYTGALNAMAKQLRAQYPGHRDFIDEQISRISGINPANAYMNNLLIDINRASTGEDVFQKQIMSKAGENLGDPGVQKYWAALQHGLPGAMEGLIQAVFKAESGKLQVLQHQQQSQATREDLAADSDLAKNQYETRAETITQRHLDGLLEIPGLDKKVTMGDITSGNLKLSGTQKDQLLQNFVTARQQLAADLQRSADAEGYSRRIKNPGETDAIAKRQLDYMDRMIDTITNDKFGSMYEMKRRLDNINNTSEVQALSSPMGNWLEKTRLLQKYAGPNWVNMGDAINLATGNRHQQLRDWFSDKTQLIGAPDEIRGNGASLINDLNEAKKAKNEGIKAPDKIYGDLVDNVSYLLKSQDKQFNPEIGKNIVQYMYRDGNEKIMDFFGKDMGQQKGRAYMLDTLTRPELTDAIWNMKDRQSWQYYKDFNEKSFQKEFKDEIQDLNQMQGDRNFPVNVNWDSKNHQLELVDNRNPKTMDEQAYRVGSEYLNYMKNSVSRLNMGLRTLSYMHDKEGSDTNSYLFDTLMQMGYSPNDRVHGDNLPQRAVQAIAASSKTNKERLEEAFSAAQKNKTQGQ